MTRHRPFLPPSTAPGAARLLLAAGVLLAGLGDASAERLRVRIGATSPYSECYCRARGEQYPVGQATCLRGPDGPRVATCGMEQNVTSWRFSQQSCPDS